jgi:hypothetical protein
LHDYFGRGTNEVMHRLKARRREVTGARPSTETVDTVERDVQS